MYLDAEDKEVLQNSVDEIFSTLYSTDVELLPYSTASINSIYRERVTATFGTPIEFKAKVRIAESGQILLSNGTTITADIQIVVSAKEALAKNIMVIGMENLLKSNVRYENVVYRIEKFISSPLIVGDSPLAYYIYGRKEIV